MTSSYSSNEGKRLFPSCKTNHVSFVSTSISIQKKLISTLQQQGIDLLPTVGLEVLVRCYSFLLEQVLEHWGPGFEQVPQFASPIDILFFPCRVKRKIIIVYMSLIAPVRGRSVSGTGRVEVDEGHELLANSIRFRWRTIRLWELASKQCIECMSRSGRHIHSHVDDLGNTMEPHPREQRVEFWHSLDNRKKWWFFQTVSGKLSWVDSMKIICQDTQPRTLKCIYDISLMNQQNMYGKTNLPSMLENSALTCFDVSCRTLLTEVVGGQSGRIRSIPTTTGCSRCKMGFVPSKPTACSTLTRAGSFAGS